MAIPVLDNAVWSSVIGSYTLAVSEPTSWAVGDLCVVLIADDSPNTGASWTAASDPAGWSFSGEVGSVTPDCRVGAYYKILASGDFTGGTENFVTQNIATESSVDIGAYALRITGADETTPIDVELIGEEANGVNTLTINAITTTQNDCLAVSCCAGDGITPTCQTTNSWVNGAQQLVNGAGGTGIGYGSKGIASAGTTQDCVYNASGTNGLAGFILAVAPAAAGGGGGNPWYHYAQQ